MTMVATCCASPPARSDKGRRLPDLKPCPFCGSTFITFDECSSQVECWDCDAKGPLILSFLARAGGDRTLAAILSWNTRADQMYEEDLP